MKEWKTLHSTTLLTHPRLKVSEDDIVLPDGRESKYIYYEIPDAAMVVCIKDDKILLQTEYSYPPRQYMYQLPGGAIDSGEEPIPAALRELDEESGYGKGDDSMVEYLGYYYINNRRSSAKLHVVLVTNPVETGGVDWDPEEYIKSEWVTLVKLREMIAKGEIVNSTVLTGLSLYDNRQQ